MRAFRKKNGQLQVCRTTEGVMDLYNGEVSEKTLQIFSPSLPTEYVTTFSGRTDAPEVSGQMDRQTDPTTVTLTAHAHQRLMNEWM